MAKEVNWIERRAKRERILNQNARDVRESVHTAVDNCVTSANECFGDKIVASKNTENGHRLLVSVAHKINSMRKSVSVEYEDDKQEIVVTQDGGSAKRFPIRSDEEHAFVTWQQQEVSPDRFTELALEDALFKAPVRSSPNYAPSGGGQWS